MVNTKNKILHWDIVIQGFGQKQSFLNGMSMLWRRLQDEHSSPGRVVSIRTWNVDWEEMALTIQRMADPDVDVRIYAYSWGGGWGFRSLAYYLWQNGVPISNVVLSDPVYRHPLMPWRALFPFMSIKVPPNVRWINYFLQCRTYPMGHHLKLMGDSTHLAGPVYLTYPHVGMDNATEFIEECLRVSRLPFTKREK